MNKFFILMILGILTHQLFANEGNGKITSVTLYRNGAYIKRVLEVNQSTGLNKFILKGLPKDIDQNSVVVKGYGDFMISGVNTSKNFLQNATEHEKVLPLIDKKKTLEKELLFLKSELEALVSWGTFLDSNLSVTGKEEPISFENFSKLEQYYKKNIKEAKAAITSQNLAIEEKAKMLDKIQLEINQLSGEVNTQTTEIQINTESKVAQKIKLEITYFTQMASWNPKYKISVEDVSLPINLSYQAFIQQSTGENWNNVELTFSSANPTNNQNLPSFSVLPLRFYEPRVSPQRSRAAKMEVMSVLDSQPENKMAYADMATGATAPTANYIDEANFFEYKLNQPYSISTGSNNIEISFNEEKVPSTYLYKTIPFADSAAFLIAKIENWQKLNLINGEASVFFNNSYVGKIFIDAKNMSSESEIPLGKDDRIQVVRKNLLGNKKSAGFTGNKTLIEYNWEIKIINQRAKSINIEIVDRVPLSKDGEIDVAFKAPADALYEVETGKLTWTKLIEPSKSMVLNNKYEIKYPINKKLETVPY
ncbi:MAG: DUF4139 domain-containing protein [Solirubrobacteraceae bacterium]